ncbi:nonstructural protein NSP9 [Grapevine Cabernet Sauvignon reovirus]|uniref:nonstructural protein NSP9 n=1 Tax=Grapevine Cabernet Sauvignon reovirus TaxID=1640277 RepID=UPI0006A6E2AB|nr:nonstructural protein NSP9 [Grapevine Cabernet Sauvignon reovirus]AKZ17739.1 nonstructural protein NSP9 [Grapevine Cabernet Sauvignon reovirus]
MNTIQVTEQTLGGRKIKVGSSPVWEAVLDWLKNGKPSPLLKAVVSELGLAPLEQLNHTLKNEDNMCVLPTRLGLVFYIPADDDRMAVKISMVNGVEKKGPNFDATDIGIAKKGADGSTLSFKLPWTNSSAKTIVYLIPQIVVGVEAVFQSYNASTVSGMVEAKKLIKQYFDVQLNFLSRMSQFAAACVYLSGYYDAFQHSMIRYVNGQFSALELIRNRRSDAISVRDKLSLIKNGSNDAIETMLYQTKSTLGGATVISALGDDFTMMTENKQGCAVKLMGERFSRVSCGEVDLEVFMKDEAGTSKVEITTPESKKRDEPSASPPPPMFAPTKLRS